jgi:hypothetical protein
VEVEDLKPVGLGSIGQFRCLCCIGREADSEITTAGPARFVVNAAFICDPPQGTVLLREDRHPDQLAELIELFPEGVNGLEESLGIAIGQGADTVGRNGAELIENWIDLLRYLLAAGSKSPQEISGAGGASRPHEDHSQVLG